MTDTDADDVDGWQESSEGSKASNVFIMSISPSYDGDGGKRLPDIPVVDDGEPKKGLVLLNMSEAMGSKRNIASE